MYTLKNPVKAGFTLFLALSLVLSTIVSPLAFPKVATAQTSSPSFPEQNEFEALPDVGFTLGQCSTLDAEFSAQYYLPGKMKLSLIGKSSYCSEMWNVEAANHDFASSLGYAFKAQKIEGQVGDHASWAIDPQGKVTIENGASVEFVDRQSVKGSIAYSSDLGLVWKAKWTKVYDSAKEEGLVTSVSFIFEWKGDTGGSANIDPGILSAVAPSALAGVVFYAVIKGESAAVVAGQAATGFIPAIMTQEQLESMKEFMQRIDPSHIPPELQAYTPQSLTVPYQIYSATIEKYGSIDPATGLLSAPSQVQPGQTFNYSGSGFAPGGQVVVSFVLNPYDDTVTQVVTADSNGNIQGSISLPSADQMMTGTYLLSAADATSAYYGAKALLEDPNASAQMYIASVLVEVAGGTATNNSDSTPSLPPSPELTCSKVSLHDMSLAYLFSDAYCGGDITWFSAHDANGPGASGQQSLYVPSGTVVNVSSNDNGGGDTTCFSATVNDLGLVGWANRIQWAQIVPGGTCSSASSSNNDYYTVHTSGGDVVIHVGETWSNVQHNWQIQGFDRHGSSHLKINHVNGQQRCWDETKSTQQLQNDGDWWIQTASIEIGSGYCPGMSGQLQVFNQANYQGGQHDIRAGNVRTYPDNDLKYSFRFTEPGMSAKLTNADGREKCWNEDVHNLQDHEDYWHRTVKIEVFGTDVCPPAPDIPLPGAYGAGQGVKFYYYEGNFGDLPLGNHLQVSKSGNISNFDLSQVGHRNDDFAVRMQSCINIPSAGNYTFYAASDDGSQVYIDGQLIVDNNGAHPTEQKQGSVTLSAGYNPIEVHYFETGGDQTLGISWSGPGFGKNWIPNSSLDQSKCTLDSLSYGSFGGNAGAADSYWDVGAFNPNGGNKFFIRYGKNDGTFSAQTSWTTTGLNANGQLFTGDFDGDGIWDVGIFNLNNDSKFYIWYGLGDGSFARPTVWYWALNTNRAKIYSGDFNGDGHWDIGAFNPNGGSKFFTRWGLGDGTFGTQVQWTWALNTTNAQIFTGDFNGDGKWEVGAFNPNGGKAFFIRRGLGDGTFGAQTRWAWNINIVNTQIFTGDFNGDGKWDVGAFNPNGGRKFFIRYGLGDGTFGAQTYWTWNIRITNMTIFSGNFNSPGTVSSSSLPTIQETRQLFLPLINK